MSDVKELLERLDALRERAIAADEQLEAYREKGDPRPDMDEEYAPVAVFEYHAALDGHYTRLRAALLEMREENAELRVALQLLRALPVTGPACSREEHDGSVCEDCTAEREYRQRCIDVLAQADEALAKGGGR